MKLHSTRASGNATEDAPDISGLPSVDYAMYLYRTVRFYLGQTYDLIEEESFLVEFNEFYFHNAADKAASSKLWFAQFLLVLAFGHAFLLNTPKSDKTPPGSVFFLRAMALIPDHLSLWKDSILAVEVSALTALYLYSVDRREPAHGYVSPVRLMRPILENCSVLTSRLKAWSSRTYRTTRRPALPTSGRGSRLFHDTEMPQAVVDTIHHGQALLCFSWCADHHQR